MADRKQTFTPEFRAEAVRLAQTSGRSRREIATDLGVGLSTLRNWIDGRREREIDHPPAERQEVSTGTVVWFFRTSCGEVCRPA